MVAGDELRGARADVLLLRGARQRGEGAQGAGHGDHHAPDPADGRGLLHQHPRRLIQVSNKIIFDRRHKNICLCTQELGPRVRRQHREPGLVLPDVHILLLPVLKVQRKNTEFG